MNAAAGTRFTMTPFWPLKTAIAHPCSFVWVCTRHMLQGLTCVDSKHPPRSSIFCIVSHHPRTRVLDAWLALSRYPERRRVRRKYNIYGRYTKDTRVTRGGSPLSLSYFVVRDPGVLFTYQFFVPFRETKSFTASPNMFTQTRYHIEKKACPQA